MRERRVLNPLSEIRFGAIFEPTLLDPAAGLMSAVVRAPVAGVPEANDWSPTSYLSSGVIPDRMAGARVSRNSGAIQECLSHKRLRGLLRSSQGGAHIDDPSTV